MLEQKRTWPRSRRTRDAVVRIASLIIVFAVPVKAAEQWIKLTTPHFEMYTTNRERKAVEALQIFEEARGFFEEYSPSKTAPDIPVRIIAFKSDKEYKPYTPNPGAAAYYQRGHRRDYIVMQELGPDFYAGAIHEYTHLFIEHLGLTLPLWLNEGLADVYSSLQPKGKQLMIGAPPPGRLEALRALPPLELRQLLSVNQESPYYTKPEQMAQFYAESWALAHMLSLGKNYKSRFPQFLLSVSEGKGVEERFEEVYHKSLSEVALDLHNYFSQGTITVALFNTHLDRKELEPEVSTPAPFEIDLVLADLLSTHPQTAAEARSRLTQLAREMPDNPEVQTSLGYLSWQEGRLDEAKQHFENALREGSKDPQMMFQYAGMLRVSGGPPERILSLLQQAIAIKPDLQDARFTLGMEAVNQGQWAMALSALTPITTVKADRAFAFFYAKAYCDWKLGNASEAHRQGDLARQYAQKPEEKARVTQFLEHLDSSPEAPR